MKTCVLQSSHLYDPVNTRARLVHTKFDGSSHAEMNRFVNEKGRKRDATQRKHKSLSTYLNIKLKFTCAHFFGNGEYFRDYSPSRPWLWSGVAGDRIFFVCMAGELLSATMNEKFVSNQELCQNEFIILWILGDVRFIETNNVLWVGRTDK